MITENIIYFHINIKYYMTLENYKTYFIFYYVKLCTLNILLYILIVNL